MNLLKEKKNIRIILIYGIFYSIAFVCLEKSGATPHLIHSVIDDSIPFCEYFIIPYMLWFVFITKCNKSQEKFLFLPIFIMTTSSKFEGDSHLDPVPYGAVALRESGGIIVPQTPKGGFNFIKAKKERPT